MPAGIIVLTEGSQHHQADRKEGTIMLLVKHHIGDGRWLVHEAADELEYLGPHVVHEVSVVYDTPDPSIPHDDPLWTLVPVYDEQPLVYLLDVGSDNGPDRAFVRWARWRAPDGLLRLLVTDARVFIMNERGDTIETIR